MNWKMFDKIFVLINPRYQQLVHIKNTLDNKFEISDFNNVEFHFKPHNKITNNIYDTLRKNKFLIDWYNTQNPGDFYGRDDLTHTLYMLNIIKRCYMLNYKYTFFFDLGCMDNGLQHNKNFKKYLYNFPTEFNGYVIMKYKDKFHKHGKNINNYYFDTEWSNNVKDINMYAISRNGMKNILDNQTMVLKRFDYYLTHRNMPYDSLVEHIALDLDK
jgi:hypothetical protein